MLFRTALFAFMLHFLNLSTGAELQAITQEQCEAFGSHVYYDTDTGHCVLEIYSPSMPESLIHNNTLHCPSNSTFQKGYCACSRDQRVSSDKKSCLSWKLHGEACSENEDDACKGGTGLECSSVGKCECKHAGADWNSSESLCYSDEDCQARNGNSYYDKDAGKCYLLINVAGFCKLLEESGRAECPPNSRCVYSTSYNRVEGICKCSPGYVPEGNSLQKCAKAKLHQEACATDKVDNFEAQDQCDVANGLMCSGSNCTCATGTKWEDLSGGCRPTTGSSCSIYSFAPAHQRCGRNADCVGHSYDAVCKCHTGFQSVNGDCYAYYESKCAQDVDCLEGMSCTDEICRCENPLSQKVARDMMSCVNLAKSPCSTNSTRLTRLATCVNGITTCSHNSVESTSGECLLSMNKECGGELGRCNFEEGLKCVRGSCKCLDVQLTYVEGVGCTAKVGGRCGNVHLIANCESNSCEDMYNIKCASGATCIPVSNSVSKCLTSDQ